MNCRRPVFLQQFLYKWKPIPKRQKYNLYDGTGWKRKKKKQNSQWFNREFLFWIEYHLLFSVFFFLVNYLPGIHYQCNENEWKAILNGIVTLNLNSEWLWIRFCIGRQSLNRVNPNVFWCDFLFSAFFPCPSYSI